VADDRLHIAAEIRDALAAHRPVVALETSVVAQGLPPPTNLEASRTCAEAVRAAGAVPAFIALLDGQAVVGADERALARLADPDQRVAKAGVGDLAALLMTRRAAGTTVSASVAIAAAAGVRVLATGGIGGVHRVMRGDEGARRDVSADLAEMSRCQVCVVASGPKIVLDVAATAEALETLGVPLVGFGTDEMPAFVVKESGVRLEHRVEKASEVAALLHIHWQALARREGVLLCVPPPSPMPRDTALRALAHALAEAEAEGLSGKAITPFLLRALDRASGGASRAANLKLLENNARVAGEVARELARG
jgi:pseudouridylate synthase